MYYVKKNFGRLGQYTYSDPYGTTPPPVPRPVTPIAIFGPSGPPTPYVSPIVAGTIQLVTPTLPASVPYYPEFTAPGIPEPGSEAARILELARLRAAATTAPPRPVPVSTPYPGDAAAQIRAEIEATRARLRLPVPSVAPRGVPTVPAVVPPWRALEPEVTPEYAAAAAKEIAQEAEFARLRAESTYEKKLTPREKELLSRTGPSAPFSSSGIIAGLVAQFVPKEKLPSFVQDLSQDELAALIKSYRSGGKSSAAITLLFIQARRGAFSPGNILDKLYQAGKAFLQVRASSAVDAALADVGRAAASIKAKIRMVADPTEFRQALKSGLQSAAQAGKLNIDTSIVYETIGVENFSDLPKATQQKLKKYEAAVDNKIGQRMGKSMRDWLNFFTGGSLSRIERETRNEVAGPFYSNYLTIKNPREASGTPKMEQVGRALYAVGQLTDNATDKVAAKVADAISARAPGVGPEIRQQIVAEQRAQQQARLQSLQQQLAQIKSTPVRGPDGDVEREGMITSLTNQIRALQSQLRVR